MLLMILRKRCFNITSILSIEEVLMNTRTLKDNGFKIKDQLLRLTLVILKVMLIQKTHVHFLKVWFQLLIKKSLRSLPI